MNLSLHISLFSGERLPPFGACVLSLFILCPSILLGADDTDEKTLDTLELAEVVVQGERVLVPAGFKSIDLDSNLRQQHQSSSLDRLLDNQPSIHFKNYGSSNISTPSFRGTSASHTAIYWDGIRLNSPTLGSIDFSLVQSGLFNNMEIHLGGSSLVDGSGALGGAIHLDNRISWTQPLTISAWQTMGSFARYSTGITAQYAHQNWKGKTVLFYKQSENNYSYINTTETGNPLEVQDHADVGLGSVLQQLHYRADARNVFSINAWLQKSDRQIPPTLAESHSQQTQDDFAARIITGWQHQLRDGLFDLKTAFLHNQTNFRDGARQLDANTKINSYRALARFRWRFADDLLLNTKLRLQQDQADTDGFATDRQRTRGDFYGGIVFKPLKKIKTSLFMRQEAGEEGLSPFLPAVGVRWRPVRNSGVTIRGNISRNYRTPTMNDLYWEPGGNQNLQAEKSWNFEGGLAWQKQWNSQWQINADVTGFHSRIDNWIQWTPTNKGYWEAQNLSSVWTAGFENRLQLSARWNQWTIHANGGYSYTRSVRMPDAQKSMREGDQLIYVPIHQYHVSGRVNWLGYSVKPSLRFTDKRYISTDNMTYLPGYAIFDFYASKELTWNRWQFRLSFTAHNILNERFFSVVNRPMPGRWFEGTVKIQFANNH